jgi:hypothetical protein
MPAVEAIGLVGAELIRTYIRNNYVVAYRSPAEQHGLPNLTILRSQIKRAVNGLDPEHGEKPTQRKHLAGVFGEIDATRLVDP